MRQEGSVPDKERFLFSYRMINEVGNGFHALSSNGKTLWATMPCRARHHAMREATIGMTPFPPFARLVSQVTAGSKQADEVGQLIEAITYWLVESLSIVGSIDIVGHNSVGSRVLTCEHRRQRRSAQRRGYISSGSPVPKACRRPGREGCARNGNE